MGFSVFHIFFLIFFILLPSLLFDVFFSDSFAYRRAFQMANAKICVNPDKYQVINNKTRIKATILTAIIFTIIYLIVSVSITAYGIFSILYYLIIIYCAGAIPWNIFYNVQNKWSSYYFHFSEKIKKNEPLYTYETFKKQKKDKENDCDNIIEFIFGLVVIFLHDILKSFGHYFYALIFYMKDFIKALKGYKTSNFKNRQ